ncbi:lytic transglycosylase [Chitinimonas arctica]|nr:LysM peptidoglycan-binding domain-containing protein [Chitinimonas arctica]
MIKIKFHLAPLFALVAALFAPQAFADEGAIVPTPTESVVKLPEADNGPAVSNSPLLNPSANPMLNKPALALPSEQTDLWVRVRQGFKMGEVDTAAVRAQERIYASKPEYMQRVIERSRRYMYFIVGEVEKRGMPTEIALLPIVESAFIPRAQSHAAASGLWQFIPSTGQRYGLERTWWYDGRQDVMAATYAALDYLQDLYNLFGDWQLALAAYNWGEGGVGRALAKSRAKGLEDGFDNIKKPQETENYVPKLLAVRNIIANPAAFGLSIPAMPNQPYFQPVSTGKHMDLQLAAKLAGTTVEELLQLNPGLIRPVFAHKEDRKLLLPVDKVVAFEENLQRYDKPLLSWQPYVTKRGESFEGIAGKFGIQMAELRDVNKLGSARAANGQTILVPIRDSVDVSERQNLAALIAGAGKQEADQPPVAARQASARTESRTESRAESSYQVQRGDTLFSIAKRNGMTAAELKRLNGMRSNHVAQGSILKLEDGGRSQAADKLARSDKNDKADSAKASAQRQHVVRRGDTLDEIARRYDVSVSDLKKWNRPAARGALRVGYKLQIRHEG